MALDALRRAPSIAAGADALIVHARKAWLKGLSPKENRDVPPLDYDAGLSAEGRASGDCPSSINGGIASSVEAERASRPCRWRDDGPRRLSGAGAAARGRSASCSASRRPSRRPRRPSTLSSPMSRRGFAEGVPLHAMTRHVLGLFNGRPGARAFRRHLSTEAVKPGAGIGVLRAALDLRAGAARGAAEAAGSASRRPHATFSTIFSISAAVKARSGPAICSRRAAHHRPSARRRSE